MRRRGVEARKPARLRGVFSVSAPRQVKLAATSEDFSAADSKIPTRLRRLTNLTSKELWRRVSINLIVEGQSDLSTHEYYIAHSSIKTASDRSFGLTVGGILGAIALVRWWWVGSLSWLMTAILVIGCTLLLAGLVRPGILSPLNKGWTKLGMLMFHVVNPVVMLLLFIITIIPAGLIMRLVRYDPLRRKLDPEARTYWIERDPPGPEPDSLRHQF